MGKKSGWIAETTIIDKRLSIELDMISGELATIDSANGGPSAADFENFEEHG